jgi:hypothetical protein
MANTLYARIRPGSRVTIMAYAGPGIDRVSRKMVPEYKPRTGRAVMLGPAGWVLNMGGKHGRPDIATPDNVVGVGGSSWLEDGTLSRGASQLRPSSAS